MEYSDAKRTNTNNKEAPKSDCLVGFDALPEQLVNRAVQSGFSFNVLCVGEPGIGKTTLLESLFAIKLDDSDTTMERFSTQPTLQRNTYLLTEGNVKLKISMIETVGYGDQIDKRNCHLPITDYIDAQFQQTLNNELKVVSRDRPFDGPPNNDSCVHVCLYFIEPTGHSLKALDLITLRHLDSKVNIVPVIAKADTLSKSELLHMKKLVREELENVRLYRWPTDDENVAPLNSQMNDAMPFAVVGSSDFVKVGNKNVRGRQYPWGVVQVENEHHCDFVRLREMLLRTNMLDLIESTHSVHYELYRRNTLTRLGIKRVGVNNGHDNSDKCPSSIELFETRRAALKGEWDQKESELKERFIERVKEKEAELKKIEMEIQAEMSSYKQWYREKREALEEKLETLNSEISSFESGRKYSQRFTAIGRKNKR